MKRNLAFVMVILVLSVGQTSAAEKVKIGVINFQQALLDVDQGKKAKAVLKGEFDARQKKLDLQQQELKKLQEEMEKQKAILSQDVLIAKQKTFSEKYLQLQKSMSDYQNELMGKQSKMAGQILQNLKKIVGELGKKEDYNLIFENSQETVLFAQGAEDLTGRIVSLYNQKFQGPLKIE